MHNTLIMTNTTSTDSINLRKFPQIVRTQALALIKLFLFSGSGVLFPRPDRSYTIIVLGKYRGSQITVCEIVNQLNSN